MQSSANTILVTGGGSGIGAALAHEFHAAGNQVIIAGRRQAALDAVAADHPGLAEATIATNLLGPIRLAHALLPQLEAQANSAILTVSSGLAFVPLAATPTYSATKAAIHSWSLSMREQLRRRVELIEIVPPGVQTDLMPGHAENADMMKLSDYIAETMALLRQQPTPAEIHVERVKFLSEATRRGDFDQVFAALNQQH